MPELQNLNSDVNGKSLDLADLEKIWKSEGEIKVVDVSSFGRGDWNGKGVGSGWHASEVEWRLNYIKGFLTGILAALRLIPRGLKSQLLPTEAF